MAQQQSDRAGAAPGGTATPAAGTAGTGAVPDPAAVAATRRAWHGVAELIMAGPPPRRAAPTRPARRPDPAGGAARGLRHGRRAATAGAGRGAVCR